MTGWEKFFLFQIIDKIKEQNKDAAIVYIQVILSLASQEVKNREYGNLLAINDNYRKIVITANEYQSSHKEGIETWNIRKFLFKF